MTNPETNDSPETPSADNVVPMDPAVTAAPAPTEPGVSELKDQLLRALAEAENTRRRAQIDREEASKYAISNFARGLLNVADNLRRAIDSIPGDLRGTDSRVDSIIAGIEATERELLSAFTRVGIKKVEAQGQMFNANFHDVMFEAPGTGHPPGTITQVVEDGYTIHDRLLRPARVGIAKATPGEGAPSSSGQTIDEQA